MAEVRLHTQVKRMRPLRVYTLEASVSVVPCHANGIAKEDSFGVSLYLSENNMERQPYKARIRYTRYSGAVACDAVDSEVDVDTFDVDTGRQGGMVYDKYVIEAYHTDADNGERILAVAQVNTVREGAQGQHGPMLVPYGSWSEERTYRSSADVKVYVERHKMFYVLNRIDTDCQGIDPATDFKNEYWRLMDYYEFIIVNAMVAEFGKIGSAVFCGDCMMSQYGADQDGNPVTSQQGYENFGKKDEQGRDLFTPHTLLNFLTGYAHFAKKNIVMHENGDIEIVGNLKAGQIGSFTISKGIYNYDRVSEQILDSSAFIRIASNSGGRFSVNDMSSVGYADVTVQSAVGVNIQAYGDNATALHLRANAGTDIHALKSYGNVLLEARKDEHVDVRGLRLGVRRINESGLQIDTCDDVLLLNKAGTGHSCRMPDASKNAGKVYYCKNTAGTWVFQNGPFRLGDRWQLDNTASINGTISFMLISDGEAWNLFYCG